MKLIFSVFFILTSFSIGFCQLNKPDSTGWGVHFGYDFTRQLGSNINISKIDKSGWEFGGGLGFDFQNNNTNEESSITLVDTSGKPITGINKIETQGNRKNLSFSVFVLKHFPIISNVDVYLGLFPHAGFSLSTTSLYTSEQVAVNYLSRNTLEKKLPITILYGAQTSLGIRYFFAPRCCIGASMGIGYRATMQNGFAVYNTTVVNSGINNSLVANSNTSTKLDYNSNTRGFYTSNVNLSCSYYFSKR